MEKSRASVGGAEALAGRADMHMGAGRLARDSAADGVEGDVLGAKEIHQPLPLGGVGVQRDIHAAAMIEAERAVQRGFAVGADGQRFAELLLEREHDFLELQTLELPIPVEALHHRLPARLEFGFLLDGLLGAGHFRKLLQEFGARARQVQRPAAEVEFFEVGGEFGPRHDALLDQRLQRIHALLLPIEPALGGSHHFGSLLGADVLGAEDAVEGLAEEKIVRLILQFGHGLFESGARGGSGFHQFLELGQVARRRLGVRKHCRDGDQTATKKRLAHCIHCSTMRDKELFHSNTLGTQTLTGAMTLPATGSPTWQTALRAAEAKKATDIRILDLREITSFADYFLICTGANQRQIQAIWDEIAKQLKETYGETPLSVEGYSNGEWVLGDFGDLVVHVFNEEKRHYYDLERLWRDAKQVPHTPSGPSLVS